MTPKSKLVHEFATERLQVLATLPERPRKAMLAKLRRGVGRVPGDLPELWGAFLADFPHELKGKIDRHRAEWAIYLALTLYALHQQGNEFAPNKMNGSGIGLGNAVRCLADKQLEHVKGEKKLEDAPVFRRFSALATAERMEELSWHLRGIVQLLRAEGIPFDYARLAKDFYRLQNPDIAYEVRLEWGQDYYRLPKDENPEEEN